MEEGGARMGLIETRDPVIAPPAKGIIDPNTGKPVGGNDPFYLTINDQLADKGFLVTATDELITWARTGSLMWMTFGLACSALGRGTALWRAAFAAEDPPHRHDREIDANVGCG